MANASAPLEFTEGERQTVSKLALAMQGVAAVLFLLAGINIVGGVIRLLGGSAAGILAVIEGVASGLLGLIILSSAASVRFMVETKYGLIHLGRAFQDLAMFFKVLLLLLIPVLVLRLLLG